MDIHEDDRLGPVATSESFIHAFIELLNASMREVPTFITSPIIGALAVEKSSMKTETKMKRTNYMEMPLVCSLDHKYHFQKKVQISKKYMCIT